jgi:hypothetical protein
MSFVLGFVAGGALVGLYDRGALGGVWAWIKSWFVKAPEV